MSAKTKTFLEVKKVVDHDCGNYRIGEISFVNYEAIAEYIERHGEFGYQEFNTFLNRANSVLWDAILKYRAKNTFTVSYGG